jgi:diketogulonate reductase-like aldo/keto reductase
MQHHLIYGTAWKKDRTTERVLKAWLAGFRAFDTACQPNHYREDLVGQAVTELRRLGIKRDDFYLQTKFTPVGGQNPQDIPYDPQASLAEQVMQSFKVSLQNLRVEYLDALILHAPLATADLTLEAWRELEMIQMAGGARKLGISNCYDPDILKELYRQAKIKPAIVQNRFYIKSGYDMEIRRWCRDYNITYQSFWTLTANARLLRHEDVQAICTALNKTPAQILFRYLHQKGVTPLTGTTNPQHMQEDLAITEFALSDDEEQRIDNLLTGFCNQDS